MKKEEASERMNYLIKLINDANKAYYENDNPTISDGEYDELVKDLKFLEMQFPDLVKEDSPSFKVGGARVEIFKEYTHRYPLLSLGNAFSIEELRDFKIRIEKKSEVKNLDFIGELKIDGLSIALIYKKGKLVLGATRGDGKIGEVVTNNIMEIEDIPKELSMNIDIEVRGEIYIDHETFSMINKEREDEGLDLFRNPRNAAAGTLRQLDSKVVRSRNLKSYIYEITYIKDKRLKTQSERLEYLEKLGFSVNIDRVKGSIEDVSKFVLEVNERRKKLNYGIDGVVVKLNDINIGEELGATEKSPRWAIAYKFPTEKVESKVESIEISVGRTGVLTPVANLTPVEISGSTVKRASLHNFDYIYGKDIRVGDYVLVQKAAEIIPEIVKVNLDKRKGTEIIVKIPKNCPICNSKAIQLEGESAIKCTGGLLCQAQLAKSIIHFASKNAMNIDGLGDKIVRSLIDKKLINKPSDIYSLTENKLLTIDGLKEKSSNNILKGIENSKKAGLGRLLFSLGIPNIGSKTSNLISRKFRNISALKKVNIDELLKIEDIGEKMAKSIVEFFANERNLIMIEELIEKGVSVEDSFVLEGDAFKDKKVVLTGSLVKYDRKEMTKLIETYGGKVVSTVSKNTDLIIIGEKPGSKYEKGIALGVKIISEKDALKLIGGEYGN